MADIVQIVLVIIIFCFLPIFIGFITCSYKLSIIITEIDEIKRELRDIRK